MKIFSRNSNYFGKTIKTIQHIILCLSLLFAISQYNLTAFTKISKDTLPYHFKQYNIDKTGLKLTITLDSCKLDKCDLFVCLVKNNRILDRLKLDWPLLNYNADSISIGSSSIFITESSSNNVTSLSLSTKGHEANYIDIEIQVLRLKNVKFSILVAQSTGFESVGQNYELFIVENKRLKKAFQSSASTAMQQTSKFKIEDVDHDGYDNIVVTEEWRIADPEVGADNKLFHIYPPTTNIRFYAVILATATSIDEILKTQSKLEKKYSCLKYDTLILSTSEYKLLKPNLYFMGDIQINKENAMLLLNKYKSCTDIGDTYIKQAK